MEIYISIGGILCIYLGYRIFIIGTNQPFKVFSDLQGWKFKAAVISPAIFLVIMGSLILCSPVIINIISIFQSEKFINSYATKLILEELREKNEVILGCRINDEAKPTKYSNQTYAEKADFSPRTLEEPERAIVTSSVLRVRKNPGTQQQIIGSLRKGNIITIKEKRGLWLRVSSDIHADGWVHGHYVKRLDKPGKKDPSTSSLIIGSF
jgi:hypothetical protein